MSWTRVDEVLDLLLPPRCLLCGQRVATGAACPACVADLPWLEGPVPAPPPFGAARAALSYEYPVDRLIAAAKFGRRVPVARGLGELLAARMPPLAVPPDAVVPVPLHWRREARRGFNQAEEVARALCRLRGWPLAAGLCRRVRPTPEQSGLPAAERQANLRGAFTLPDPAGVAGCRHILVVDDVLTTGATAAALGTLLHAAGARALTLWAVAWTAPQAQAAPRKV